MFWSKQGFRWDDATPSPEDKMLMFLPTLRYISAVPAVDASHHFKSYSIPSVMVASTFL